ncbi:hypothetical protein VNI00_002223 [Paramarasmius palmivorus]|uniref:CSC1/OSCA1-like 7TM region domain-containing protein n=1 Tax=Paramarasmius palmivorus TaxID=297713 RepID=A0AAW0E738_9AGAR
MTRFNNDRHPLHARAPHDTENPPPNNTGGSSPSSETRPPSSPTGSRPSSSQETGSGASTGAGGGSSGASTSGGSGAIFTTTFTTSVPVSTVISQSTTFTSFSQSLVTTTVNSGSQFPTSSLPSSSSTSGTALPGESAGQISSQAPVCLGNGLDTQSDGLIASLVLFSGIGLLIWLLFAILRPRFRQVYAVREWFIQQDTRPKPLGSGFFAWLFPHVPLVPSLPDDDDASNHGRSATNDAENFPSDEQLSQRVLWIAFLIALGWTIIGLAGALPIYLINTPCLADQPSTSQFGGSYSVLQDLSLLRVLELVDSGNVSTVNLATNIRKRAEPTEDSFNTRPRIIALTVIAIVLGLLPALWKIVKEFNGVIGYRKRWLLGKCQGKELAWLSARDAPGFTGWGEKRLKDFVLKTGLSSSLDDLSRDGSRQRSNGNGQSSRSNRRRDEEPLNEAEKAELEVDINAIFSICDTQMLALLIERRDEILENLEIAEAKYINSFRLSTPEPSIADFEPPVPKDQDRPYISRPMKYGAQRKRSKRSKNPAPAASSLAPTSFVAPSQYYKLQGVSGVSGGRFTDTYQYEKTPSTSDFDSRIFNRDSQTGLSATRPGVDYASESASVTSYPFPDPRKYGPNFGLEGLAPLDEEEWVDLTPEANPDMQSAENGLGPGPSTSFRRRPLLRSEQSKEKRETFPFRNKGLPESPEDVPPPHLRLQPSQPFVRPLDGVNYDDLGHIYSDIARWRTSLKQINADIAEAQRECYNDIAEGVRIKGWLFVGQGLRHIPKMQMIDGRSKDDIRWDVLQNERTVLDHAVYYGVLFVVAVSLAAGLTAACGLALATAPDFAHYLPFLQSLWSANTLAAGIATVLAPAVAITLFVYIALRLVHWASELRGSISVSGGRLQSFRATFYFLAVVCALWIIAVGALLFGIRAFSEDSESARPRSVANGSIYMSVLAMAVILQVAIIFPGLLILQPMTLWRVTRKEKYAITPRQRFRAVYPRTYQPSSFTTTGACIVAIVFASTFALIFPLIGPAVVVLILLTLVAHRFLTGYVYAPNTSTGGLLQIWMLRRLGTLLALQPILLGLIFLSREIWIEGGVLAGTGVLVILFVETYTQVKTSERSSRSLSAITKDSVETFASQARSKRMNVDDEESTSLVGSRAGTGMRTRGSMASVLEMMSLTLAVMPSQSRTRGPVPLPTESLDDLLQTERAAQTHPDAPPHLPALPFADHAEEMAGILYAPELIAPPPIIWLPNDTPGVGKSEAVDLQKYHDLQVTLDISQGGKHGPRRSSSPRSHS